MTTTTRREPGEMDLVETVDAVMRLDAGARALCFEEHWYTWGELTAYGDGVLGLVAGSDVPPDRAVGVLLRNEPLCVAVLLAALRARRPVLTFSGLLPDAALAADIRGTRPAALVVPPADADRAGLADALAAVGGVGIRAVDDPSVLPGTRHDTDADHFIPSAGTVAVMLTSGTTGPPKRVALTYEGLAHAVHSANRHHEGARADAAPRLRDATSIIDLPLFNITSYLDIAMTVAAGRRICLMRRFEPWAWARAVRGHRVVVSLLVPAALRMVLDARIPEEWLTSLKVVRSGSAPLDPKVAEEFEERYGIPLIVSYGATEFSGALAGLTMADRRRWGSAKRGSVGRPHPGVELRILDPDDGHELEAGQVGVLLARAPQIAGTEPGGWARTNDLARLDADGFLFIEGRVDDVIIRGGFKVDPSAVADVLRLHPDVADAAVVPLSDPRLGQVPVAAVVLRPSRQERPGEELEGALQDWVRERLVPYAVPVRIRAVQALPRTPTMKIAQRQLLDLLRS
ncbi:class I adenylate-forming enzyme family protein [Streptomyces sp. NPDC096311]|uniref:class I adenylate-forming enzyme family protein n=1 Tax=Streptomyces sp. NPDC096311 TaxID=3366083 RepID=UPI003801964A